MHMSDFQPISYGHGRSKNIAAPYHHDFVHPAFGCIGTRIAERRIEARGQNRAPRNKTQIAREHDVRPAFEQFSNGLYGSCGP